METKKSKYDTNPLEPDVEKKAEEVWRGLGGVTQQVGGTTNQVADTPNDKPRPPNPENARQNVYSEAPTRRYDNPPLETPYPSVFVPPTYSPPAQYSGQNIYQSPMNTSSRTVPGIGLSEKWAATLPYMPLWIGLIISLLELFLVPRKEVKVRFHASQALALHIMILVVETLFRVIGAVTGSSLGRILFGLAA